MRATFWASLSIIASFVVLGSAANSLAAYTTTNGGFDAQGAEVDNIPTVTPTGWFVRSNDVDTFSDALLRAPVGNQGIWDFNGLLLGNDTPYPTDGSGENGYAYQSIGTYSGEASLTVTGSVYSRTNSNLVGDFDIAIFYSDPGTFTPAVGTDLAGSAAFLVSEKTFTEGIDFPTITGAVAMSAPWSATFTLTGSGVTAGDTVWLRLGDGGNPLPVTPQSDQPVLDNINIAPCTLGDANCDGTADINTDLAAIRANFRKTTGVTRAMGDVDGSGDVDFLDYFQWRTRYLALNPGSAGSVPGLFAPVPEPSSFLLLGLGMCGVSAVRRRRSLCFVRVA